MGVPWVLLIVVHEVVRGSLASGASHIDRVLFERPCRGIEEGIGGVVAAARRRRPCQGFRPWCRLPARCSGCSARGLIERSMEVVARTDRIYCIRIRSSLDPPAWRRMKADPNLLSEHELDTSDI